MPSGMKNTRTKNCWPLSRLLRILISMPTFSLLYTLGHLNPSLEPPLHRRSRHARSNPRKIGMKTNTPVRKGRRNSVREGRRRLNWQAGGLLEQTNHSTKRRGNTSLNDDECLLSLSSVSSLLFHICPLICFLITFDRGMAKHNLGTRLRK